MKIRIFYYDESGTRQSYIYSGGACSNSNAYVQSVVSAYNYNKANWQKAGFSGKSQTEILVERDDKIINVSNRNLGKDAFNDTYETLYWDPTQGTKHTNGTTTSPATDFDHEADHANAYIDKLRLMGDAEEMRVINGSEQQMALANGDIIKGQRTRSKHSDGEIIIVDSVTSNVENKEKTKSYREKVKSYNYFSQD